MTGERFKIAPKQMIYSSKEKRECIALDEYKGYMFAVMNYGSHPCCYIRVKREDSFYEAEKADIPLTVHGGRITFKQNSLKLSKTQSISGRWIGWDYSGFGDQVLMPNSYVLNGHAFTIEELIDDCMDVINQIVRLKEAM